MYHEGDYTARILASKQYVGAEKKTGEEYLMLSLQIQPIIYHGKDGDYDVSHAESRRVAFFLKESDPDGVRKVLADLQMIGWEGSTVADFLSFGWSDRQIKVYCRHSTGGDGKKYDNFYLSHPKKEVDQTKLSKFDKLIAKVAPKRSSKPTPQPVATPATTEPQPIQNGEERPDDDIPF